MPGFSFSLPVYTDDVDGFELNKTYLSLAQQNLKCLLLTNPGEKIMYPKFGCGIKRVLFEAMTNQTYDKVKSRIKNQVAKWLPYIRILDLRVIEPHTKQGDARGMTSSNEIGIEIAFEIGPIGEIDQIKLYFKL